MTTTIGNNSDRQTIKRQQRKWWMFHGGTVVQITGCSCAPEHPDHWWIPELNTTLCEGYHLFEDEIEAIDACIADLKDEIQQLEQDLDRNEDRRKKLLYCAKKAK